MRINMLKNKYLRKNKGLKKIKYPFKIKYELSKLRIL